MPISFYPILLFMPFLTLSYVNIDRSVYLAFYFSFKAYKAPNDSYIWNAKRLYDYLMEDYKTSLRPVNHSKEAVTVHLDLKSFWVEDLVSCSLSRNCFELVAPQISIIVCSEVRTSPNLSMVR